MLDSINFGGFVTSLMSGGTSALAAISPLVALLAGIALAIGVVYMLFGVFGDDIDTEIEWDYNDEW